MATTDLPATSTAATGVPATSSRGAALRAHEVVLALAASVLVTAALFHEVTVGGATGEGDACNAVTLAFLDAVAETPVSDPHLFLRWHEGIDGIAWQNGLDMLSAGRSMPRMQAIVPPTAMWLATHWQQMPRLSQPSFVQLH